MNLATLIEASNVPQTRLAQQLGVSRVSLWRWIAGEAEPSQENTLKLASYFDVDPTVINPDYTPETEVQVVFEPEMEEYVVTVRISVPKRD